MSVSTIQDLVLAEPILKTYAECAVQTEAPLMSPTPPPPPPPVLSPFRPSSPLEDTGDGSLIFLESDSLDVHDSAYTHSSPHPAYVQPRSTKPRLNRNQPSDAPATDAGRVVSMPETAPGFLVKTELKQSYRIVSMPDPPARPLAADSSISSDFGNMSLLSSAASSSFASVSDATTGIYLPLFGPGPARFHTPSPSSSSDSILIIENNGELAEGFLHPETIKEETEEELKAKDDKGATKRIELHHPPLSFLTACVRALRLDFVDTVSAPSYSCSSRPSVFALCTLSVVRCPSMPRLCF
jgi:hypothetical protein